jgi:hypothetical protein
MRFFTLIFCLCSGLGILAEANTKYPELSCVIPLKILKADGSLVEAKFQILAGPIDDGHGAAIEYSVESKDENLANIINAESALVDFDQQSPSTLRFIASGIRIESNSKNCSGRICTAKLAVSDRITHSVDSPQGELYGEGKCDSHFVLTLREAIEASLNHYPDIKAGEKAVEVAESEAGPLYQRFGPIFSAGAQNVNSNNFSGLAGVPSPSRITSFSSQVGLNLSPRNYFSWNDAVIAANSARPIKTILENRIALQVVGLYNAIEVNRQQIRDLALFFLKTINIVHSDPNVIKNRQLLDGVEALISATESELISRRYYLVTLIDDFKNFTGIVLDHQVPTIDDPNNIPEVENPDVFLSNVYDASLPLFPSADAATRLAKEKSPVLKAAHYAEARAKNNEKGTKLGFFDLIVGVGPTATWAALPGALPSIYSSSSPFSLGAQISMEPFSYRRQRKSARLNVDMAKYSSEGEALKIQSQTDKDFFTYLEKLQIICTQRAQFTKTIANFVTVAKDALGKKAYDPLAFITYYPQAISALSQLYSASIEAIAAAADIHAQIGDLNVPSTWEISTNPVERCPSPAKKELMQSLRKLN